METSSLNKPYNNTFKVKVNKRGFSPGCFLNVFVLLTGLDEGFRDIGHGACLNQGDFGGAFDAVRGGHVTVLDEPVVLVVECEHTEDIVSYSMEGVWRVVGEG